MIFESGGKQFQASPGERLRLEKLDAEVGSEVQFDRVLLVHRDGKIQVGRPYLEGARVVGTVLEQDRDKKVLVFKKKRRKQYRRTHGHRQAFTAVTIDKIEGKG
ncbi:MAG TPA: 50S ribosomal protein L21 [Vicinamibacteria bacterium]|nr:50S ribosomal protein L21 [Vicinamibacteria bacterium]